MECIIKFQNDILKYLLHKLEDYGKKCLGIDSKLEFKQRNKPNYHILPLIEGEFIEDIDQIDYMISA